MPTQHQEKQTEKNLREYRKKFLTKKENLDADESTARLMINNFLTDVLGYALIDEIKTEHMIRGTYVDYVIQLNKRIPFIIEAKATSLNLNSKHLKQSVDYAANEGVDWVILTNGQQLQLHRVIFEKPIRSQKIFDYDLSDLKTIRQASADIVYLTKKSVEKDEIETYWKRFDTLNEKNIVKILHSPDIIKAIRLKIRREKSISFSDVEIKTAIDSVLATK